MYYTAKLSAKLDSSGRIVITSDIYNTTATRVEVTETGSGNWTKLVGFNAGSWNNSRTNTENKDWNGIKKGQATLTGSVGGMTLNSIRPFQTSTDGKSLVNATRTFDVFVGAVKVGTVTYNQNSTLKDVIKQINDMQYDYATGVKVSSPFKDDQNSTVEDTNLNDDNSYNTKAGNKLENGAQAGYIDGSGQVHYTAQLQASLVNGKIVITSDVYNTTDQAITVKNDTGSFTKLTGLASTGTTITNNGTLNKGDEGVYTYTGAAIAGMKGDTDLTFVGSGKFTVTIDDGSRTDTNSTVNLKEIKFDVNVLENDSVQNVLDKIVSQAKAQIASKYGVSASSIYMEASVVNNKIVIKMDGKYGENITFTNDTSDFVQRTGLSTVSKTYAEHKTIVKESSGYDRITGSVDSITKGLVMGNLTSESFTISGGNGTYTVSIQNGWSVQKIIDEIYSQTNGHYKAGIFNAEIFNQNHQQNVNNYDNAAKGSLYIESTVQTSTDTTVSNTDLTRRLGLVASELTTGAKEETFKGDHGYFKYESNAIKGLKPNSIISGIKDGKLTFTLHATQATGQTGSVTYRPDITYTIDVVYNDTVTSILNKMKQAILKEEDDRLEHSDVTGDDRLDRLDFHVEYDAASDSGKISLQLIGNYASKITFDSDTSGFVSSLGLDKMTHTYSSNYTSKEISSGKSMLTGSEKNLSESKIFGNMQGGTLILSAGSTTKTINVLETDRIKDVIDKINEGGLFSAGIDEQGRLYVKTNAQNGTKVVVSGTSEFGKLTGLTGGSWSYSAETQKGNEDYTKITGSVWGLEGGQTFNNMSSGSFYIKGAGLQTVSVNVVKGSTKVSDVINQINASADFKAELDEAGRLVISTKRAVGSDIVIEKGTTNYTSVVGLSAGTLGGNAVFNSGAKDVYSSLKGTVTGLDTGMRFSAGDFKISVTDEAGRIQTKTFRLTGNETLSDVASMISNSELGLSAVINASDNSLVLKSKESGAKKIALTDGTSNFAESTGFTKNGAQASSAIEGSLSTLTSTKTVQNAQALGFSAGDFTISLLNTDGSVSASKKIEITKTDTIDSVISKINNSGLGLTAAINAAGNLVLQRNATDTAGGIAVSKGTSDFTNKIGFSEGGMQSSGAVNKGGSEATRSVLKSNALSAAGASSTLGSLGITDGTFKINGVSIAVKSTESIASLLSKINATFAGNDASGVYAEYTDNRIVLTGNSASENAVIRVEAGSSNISEVLGLTTKEGLNEAVQKKGDNAIYTINGVEYESQSNVVSLTDAAQRTNTGSADEAIRITIKEKGTGTIDIGKKSLTDAANKLSSFVNSFNSTMTLGNSAGLSGDPEFAGLQQAIKNALVNNVGGYKQVTKELAAMGITIYSTTTAGVTGEKIAISFNKDKFINAYLKDPEKVLDVLIGNESKPLDSTKAGSMTRLSDTLQNAVSGYFTSSISNLETQAKNIALQIAQNTSELNNITNSLALGSSSSSFEDMSAYLKQLEDQYNSVNNLIKKMKNNYNQSITRLVLNPV